jgi:hypothetical protein
MDDILTCKYSTCNKFYQSPIILPCFNTMCQHHINEIEQELALTSEKKTFKCEFCDEHHDIPDEGFKFNSEVNRILKLNQHLNERQKEARQSLTNLEKSIDEFFELAKDPETFLYEHISELTNQIDLTREKLKEKIDLISEEMLAKINEWHSECKFNLRKANETKDLARAEQDYRKKAKLVELSEELRTPKMSNQRLDEILIEINKYGSENKLNIKNYKNYILKGKSAYFKPANKVFSAYEDFGLFILKDLNMSNFMMTDQSGICIKTLKDHSDYVR